MRQKIIAGNWKMNKTLDESVSLARDLNKELGEIKKVDIVLCPTCPCLEAVNRVIKGSVIKLGAQNMHWESSGAFTGEVSAEMLISVGCKYVILGHSERRQYFSETDQNINKKIKSALKAGLIPIVCVGETLEQRQKGITEKVVDTQVRGCLADLAVVQAQVSG